MFTAPAPVADAPDEIVVEPVRDILEDPLATVTSPDSLACEAPDITLIAPDRPPESADTTCTDPPTEFSDVAAPLARTTDPAAPLVDAAARIWIPPLVPSLVVPVLINTEPEEP